jgi:hypothetical protein
MLIVTPSRFSTSVKAALVNCEPWSLLKISGVLAQGVLQAIDAEHGFHAVADPPTEHPPRVPVDDRHQVGEAARQPDVRYVRAPNLVWPDHGNATQQIGIDLVLWVRAAGVGARRHPRQPQLLRQAPYPLAIGGGSSSS